MLINNDDFKYEMTYKDPFEINQCWNDETVALHCGDIKIGYNIHYVKPYTSDKNIEDIKC